MYFYFLPKIYFNNKLFEHDSNYYLNIFFTSTDCNYSWIELRLSALFYQKSNSVKGPGSLPYFKTYSGSYFKTFFIYLVHVIIDPSKTWALSLSGVISK